jgi:hypothetical protein
LLEHIDLGSHAMPQLDEIKEGNGGMLVGDVLKGRPEAELTPPTESQVFDRHDCNASTSTRAKDSAVRDRWDGYLGRTMS